MFPKSFSDFTFYQKKKDILIYKAADSNHQYILKCSENTTPALKQALLDEYEGLSPLSHPSLPKYYGFCENFSLPESNTPVFALCMECCDGSLLPKLVPFLALEDLLYILLSTGKVLSYLLEKGILYTDLHPSNVLIRKTQLIWWIWIIQEVVTVSKV